MVRAAGGMASARQEKRQRSETIRRGGARPARRLTAALLVRLAGAAAGALDGLGQGLVVAHRGGAVFLLDPLEDLAAQHRGVAGKIGRASCRERVCQYV